MENSLNYYKNQKGLVIDSLYSYLDKYKSKRPIRAFCYLSNPEHFNCKTLFLNGLIEEIKNKRKIDGLNYITLSKDNIYLNIKENNQYNNFIKAIKNKDEHKIVFLDKYCFLNDDDTSRYALFYLLPRCNCKVYYIDGLIKDIFDI